jgi:hypothetical protein
LVLFQKYHIFDTQILKVLLKSLGISLFDRKKIFEYNFVP